jgi:hypothetical protein
MAITTLPIASGGLQQYEQIFTSSGTWTKPNGVKTVEVTVVGASKSAAGTSTAPTSAGGYYRGIFDVSGVSSVAVTVGATGTTAGDSSFGTSIVCPGNQPGGFYKPSEPGFDVLNGSRINMPSSDIWWGLVGGALYGTVANNGRMFMYGSGGGNQVTSMTGNGWSTISGGGGFNAGQKVMYGSGVYLWLRQLDSAGYDSNYGRSSDGVNWTWASMPYYYTRDFTSGPAGFVVSYTDGTMGKTTDGVTWTTYTPTGMSHSQFYLQATSTHYYAFPYQNAWSSIYYTSTDGVAWTMRFANLLSSSSYYGIKHFTTKNDKVYALSAYDNTLTTFTGETYTTTSTTSSTGGFSYQNIPIWNATFNSYGPNTFYTVESPTALKTVLNPTDATYGQYVQLSFINKNYNMTFSYSGYKTYLGSYSGYAGSTGVIQDSAAYNYHGSAGVISAGVHGNSYCNPIPGRGDDSGWGQGATYTSMVTTPGSGARTNYLGNSGAVRVRWWA